MPKFNAAQADDPMEQIVGAFDDLSATVQHRLDGFEARLKPIDRFLDKPIPAASRRGGIETPRQALRGSTSLSAIGDPSDFAAMATLERGAIANFLRSGSEDSFAELNQALGGGGMMAAGSGMSVGSDPDGGYLVTPVLSNSIKQRVWDVSPIGRLARRVEIEIGDSFEEPLDTGDIDAKWVSETEDRPELDTTKLKYLKVPVNELYTLQPVTQRLLDDSRFDIGGWIETKISDKFARKEGNAFLWGDGIEKPLGLLFNATTTDKDGVRPYFTFQHVENASVFQVIYDKMIELVYSLRAPYRKNARWLMNLKTAGSVRKIKDADGNYLWADAIEAGQPPVLLGYPVEIDEEMPDMATGQLAIAFGDFEQAYIVVDKPGIRMIRDPYTKKPFVLFYAYKRVGGQPQNGEAVKFLRFVAS